MTHSGPSRESPPRQRFVRRRPETRQNASQRVIDSSGLGTIDQLLNMEEAAAVLGCTSPTLSYTWASECASRRSNCLLAYLPALHTRICTHPGGGALARSPTGAWVARRPRAPGRPMTSWTVVGSRWLGKRQAPSIAAPACAEGHR